VHELALLLKSKTQKVIEEQALKESLVIEKKKTWIEKHNKEGMFFDFCHFN